MSDVSSREFPPLVRRVTRRLRAGWLSATGRREEAVLKLARMARGWMRTDEMRLLYRTARATPGPGDMAEIGSWKGRSTTLLGLAIRDRGEADCRLHAIDPHQGVPGEGQSLEAFRRNVRFTPAHRVVNELVLTSDEALDVLRSAGVQLRLLFVDGAHDEESVLADLRGYVPLVRPGGVVVLHDCVEGGLHPGVWRAYRTELAPRCEEVARAESLLVTRLPEDG